MLEKQLFIEQMAIATDSPVHCFYLFLLVKNNSECSGIVQHCMLFSRASGFIVWCDFSIAILEQHEYGHEMWTKHVAVLQ